MNFLIYSVMKKTAVFFICQVILFLHIQVFAGEKPSISDVRANTGYIPLYEKFELTFQALGEWDNPFDPEQVLIDCIVETPDGSSFLMPAFYFQDYHRLQSGHREQLEPFGGPCWKVRLTPKTPGTYHYHLRMKNGDHVIESGKRSFEATGNSNKHGFIQVSKENPSYFEYGNGDPYFVIGENMLVGDIPSMNKWLTSLARAGGNFIRTWWCYGAIDLESRFSDRSDRSLGKIDQESAWVADYQIDLAEKLDIAVMACFETQQFLRENVRWNQFSYNAANGGPVKTPGEYFANKEAMKYFKRRLRYIVARWAYSTSLFSWQFWNEVNSVNNFDVEQASEWHREMERYLKEIDPYQHIVHTNFGHLDGRKLIDSQPEMEIVSTNSYSRRDMAQTAIWATRWMTSHYQKPYLLTEFGLGHEGGWAENDPKGVMVHNALWGAAMGGAAGAGLPWGWGNWIDAQNMYPYFKTLSEVTRNVPFNRLKWHPVDVERFLFRDPDKEPYYANVFFEGFPRNYSFEVCPDPKPGIFRINPDGEVENEECLNAALFSKISGEQDENEPDDFTAAMAADSKQTLQIDMPSDGQLIVHVPELGKGSNPVLSAKVDEKEVLHVSLQQQDNKERWAFFKSFPVDLDAGYHEVTIANAQTTTKNKWKDVLYVAYELTNYRLRQGPDLDYVGLQSDDHIMIWLRNPNFTWMFDRIERVPGSQPEGILIVKKVIEGNYTMVWTDTLTGKEISRGVISTRKGKLEVPTPRITQSAVAHLIRMK